MHQKINPSLPQWIGSDRDRDPPVRKDRGSDRSDHLYDRHSLMTGLVTGEGEVKKNIDIVA